MTEMKPILYGEEKRQRVLQEKNIDLQKVKEIMESGDIVDIVQHPTRPHQKFAIINYEGYACDVPYVEDNEKIFLKTARYSRKSKKKYKQYF